MSDVTVDQVWQLVEQLSPRDRKTLLSRLQSRSSQESKSITLEEIMAERDRRLTTGESVSGLPSLRNAYSDPNFDLSEEELRRSINGFANEWEQELDEHSPSN